MNLAPETIGHLLAHLGAVSAQGTPSRQSAPAPRQPVHTVYGGAHLFAPQTIRKLGDLALKSLQDTAPTFVDFSRALQIPGYHALPSDQKRIRSLIAGFRRDADYARESNPPLWMAYVLYERVVRKLKLEPVEDYRIDFEDGYGYRPDREEDSHAAAAGRATAEAFAEDLLSPFIGIRIKPLTKGSAARAIQTLNIFLTELLEKTGGNLPPRFAVSLPKVSLPDQVRMLTEILHGIEAEAHLPPGSMKVELMMETPQALINAKGEVALPGLVTAAGRRCRAVHFGAYDFTAACGITAAHQHLQHPLCDLARSLMSIALANSGVHLSDGATNVIPAAPHRPRTNGRTPTLRQQRENSQAVHTAWQACFANIRHALRSGFYQGWDLHPAHLPVRYGATYLYFLESLPFMTSRLRAFLDMAGQATRTGTIFDDAATGQGMLNFFGRGLNCGALTAADLQPTGLTDEDVRTRSLLHILEHRHTAKPAPPRSK